MCKLDIFADEIDKRQVVAARYAEAVGNRVITPTVPGDRVSVWAQYTSRVPRCSPGRGRGGPAKGSEYADCDLLSQTAAPSDGVSAFSGAQSLAVSDRLSGEAISLPMHPYLDEGVQERIVKAREDAL
jgi:dTDP-4-amino-4,6-dideoxygalactose transaminase